MLILPAGYVPGANDDAVIDAVYDAVDGALAELLGPERCPDLPRVLSQDGLLAAGALVTTALEPLDQAMSTLSPEQMPAEIIVTVLIATLSVRSWLPGRAGFIERARLVLDREAEGAEEILHGLC